MSNFRQKFSATAVLSGLFLFILGVCTADSADSNTVHMENTKEKDIYDVPYKENFYGDAVAAISDSDMFGAQRSEAIGYLPKFVSESQFKAVKSIAESDMFGTQRVEAIRKIFA